MITSLEKNDLIILDDFGLQPVDTNIRLALLQILEERYEHKSMIIASQLSSYSGDICLVPSLYSVSLTKLIAYSGGYPFSISGDIRSVPS